MFIVNTGNVYTEQQTLVTDSVRTLLPVHVLRTKIIYNQHTPTNTYGKTVEFLSIFGSGVTHIAAALPKI